jgi:CheY-like chemotaxis protein
VFDLVVSDVGLPDGTGLDFIKAYREHSDVPAIALTGFGTDEDVRRCLARRFHVASDQTGQLLSQLEQLIESTANLKAGETHAPAAAGGASR